MKSLILIFQYLPSHLTPILILIFYLQQLLSYNMCALLIALTHFFSNYCCRTTLATAPFTPVIATAQLENCKIKPQTKEYQITTSPSLH